MHVMDAVVSAMWSMPTMGLQQCLELSEVVLFFFVFYCEALPGCLYTSKYKTPAFYSAPVFGGNAHFGTAVCLVHGAHHVTPAAP